MLDTRKPIQSCKSGIYLYQHKSLVNFFAFKMNEKRNIGGAPGLMAWRMELQQGQFASN